jgi:protein ImuB
MLWVALHFNPLPPGTLENLAAWACQFTPRVSLEPPQALLAEVEGSLRFFGGSGGFRARLNAGLAELGLQASLGVAATPRAALWHARGGERHFEAISVAAVCSDERLEFLKSIGVAKIGELLALPREGLAKRCGQGLLDELDRARGLLPEARMFFAPPVKFDASLELPGEVTHAEGVLFAARRLLLQLEGLLTARHAGVRRFMLVLSHQKKKSTELQIDLASPARSAERFARLLREQLAKLSLREPVEAIRLHATDFVPLHARTVGFFGDAAADEEGWAQLLERLRARLGHGAIHGLTAQPDHRPEHAWRRVEPGEWDPRACGPRGPRPLWLLEPPRRVAEMQLELLAGPERIESGWWDGDEARRDYFVARAGDDALVWVYRENDGWFMHGLFA